ncbi:hypothetical protein [Streptomyces sp. NRRL S-37]|uniref:hypothetical protein n=1 Tax=Streptomyces sp. NRRL S-37 TaxID=1463903 RepID=UPI0004CBF37F|nr:hypothetical protein [Streptomyces sp. NRRL S-37]
MVDRARHKLVQESRPHDEWGDWRVIGGHGLPGGLTWDEFVASSSQARHLRNIAGTRPLQLLARSGSTWLLPRAYTEFLDRKARHSTPSRACRQRAGVKPSGKHGLAASENGPRAAGTTAFTVSLRAR